MRRLAAWLLVGAAVAAFAGAAVVAFGWVDRPPNDFRGLAAAGLALFVFADFVRETP